ncbi:MAG: hypothetical protein JKY28_05445 [Sulfurimonas sp.]|nr:hypothetical protein [Sulfurimonas sp.]
MEKEKYKKIIKYVLIAIPLLFLAKCGVESVVYNSNKTPDINPNPKEKLRVFGKFPLDIEKYHINTSIRYFASNPKCDTQHWLAGASSIQEVMQGVITTMKDSTYEVVVYKDYYKQGICDWKIEDIILNTISKDDNQTSYSVFFTTNNRVQNTDSIHLSTKPINFICDYKYIAGAEYTYYSCADASRSTISSKKVIKISDLQNEFEVNFKQMAEPAKTLNKGN